MDQIYSKESHLEIHSLLNSAFCSLGINRRILTIASLKLVPIVPTVEAAHSLCLFYQRDGLADIQELPGMTEWEGPELITMCQNPPLFGQHRDRIYVLLSLHVIFWDVVIRQSYSVACRFTHVSVIGTCDPTFQWSVYQLRICPWPLLEKVSMVFYSSLPYRSDNVKVRCCYLQSEAERKGCREVTLQLNFLGGILQWFLSVTSMGLNWGGLISFDGGAVDVLCI